MRWQAGLMRRFEQRAMFRASLSTFVTQEELEIADRAEPGAAKLLVPNVLPQSDVRRAEAISRERSRRQSEPLLVYLGTLTYPPNVAALRDFLEQTWPRLRASVPELELVIVGTTSESERRLLASAPGIEMAGFVPDLTPLLSRAAAVILPFEAAAGSSLRVLFCGLSKIPLIGSPAAFRGFPAGIGLRARTSDEWLELVASATRFEPFVEDRNVAMNGLAWELQQAREPWDTLYGALAVLTSEEASTQQGVSSG